MTAATVPESRRPPAPAIHPGWLRLTHWLNALAVLVMIASGWRIYNASPLYDFSFPRDYAGRLAGRRAAMAFRRHVAAGPERSSVPGVEPGQRPAAPQILPLSPRGVLADLGAALRGRLSPIRAVTTRCSGWPICS